jgi:hypothetical protein
VAIEPGPFRTNFLDGSSLSVAQTQFDDYSATGGAARAWATDTNYGQDGDPTKAAKIIVDLASYDELPERIQLGANAVYDVAEKLQRTASDQKQWWSISLSTDHVCELNGFGVDPQVTDTGIVRCAPAPIRQIGAGDDAANITGATLSVDGGWSAV